MNSSRSQNIALIIIVFFGIDVHIVTSKHVCIPTKQTFIDVNYMFDFLILDFEIHFSRGLAEFLCIYQASL